MYADIYVFGCCARDEPLWVRFALTFIFMRRGYLFLAFVLAVVATLFPVIVGGYVCATLPQAVYAYSGLVVDFSNYIVPARYTRECLWGNFCFWEVFRSPYFVVSWLPYLFYGVAGGIFSWWLLILLNQVVVFFLFFVLLWMVVRPRGWFEFMASALLGVIFCGYYLLRFGPTQWGYLSLLLLWAGMAGWESKSGRLMTYAGLLIAVSSYVFAGLYAVVSYFLFVFLRYLLGGERPSRSDVVVLVLVVLLFLVYRFVVVLAGADVHSFNVRSNLIASRLPVLSLRQVAGYVLLFVSCIVLLVFRRHLLAALSPSQQSGLWLCVSAAGALCAVPFHTLITGYSAQEWHFFYRWGFLSLMVLSLWLFWHVRGGLFKVYGFLVLAVTPVLWWRTGHALREIRQMTSLQNIQEACGIAASVERIQEAVGGAGAPVLVFTGYKSAYLLQLVVKMKPVPVDGNSNMDIPLDIAEKYSLLAFLADHPTTAIIPTRRADTMLLVPYYTAYPITPLRLGYVNGVLSQAYMFHRLGLSGVCHKLVGRILASELCSYAQIIERECNEALQSPDAFRRLWIKEASCIMKAQWDSVASWIAGPDRVFREVEEYFGGWDYVVVPAENILFWEERVIKGMGYRRLYCDGVFCLLGRREEL